MVYAALPFVAAHGMIWVPPGYSYGEAMFGLDEVRGGSGYGSGTFAGPTGQRQPSSVELGQAEHQVHHVCLQQQGSQSPVDVSKQHLAGML